MLKKENEDKTTEETIEGFEILSEKHTKLNKKEFFNILKKESNGLILTIDRVGKTFKSKWANDDGTISSGCFIDYTFIKNSENYEVGISYNLGVPLAEETFKLTSGMNIFKILAITIDIAKAEEIKVTKQFIEDSLTGVKFIAEIDSGHNGFIIKPTKKLQ